MIRLPDLGATLWYDHLITPEERYKVAIARQ